MEPDNSQLALQNFLKRHWLPLFFALGGLIFLGYGLIGLLGKQSPQKDSFTFTSGTSSIATKSAQTSLQAIVVDIEGGVVDPGLYHLTSTDRMQDLVKKAGGISEEADTDWVAKNLNLAAKLHDGEKVYVKKQGDSAAPASDGSTAVAGNSTSALVDINNASAQDLDALPGIGPVTAQKIIAARPYNNVQDLLTNKVVTQKVFDKIKDLITAN